VDAIQEIPSTSFVRNAKIEEESLLLQANAIESLLDVCSKIKSDRIHDNWTRISCTDGAELLILALRTEINSALNDSTATTNPQQMTKSEVLSTVDFLALQLLGTPTIQESGHSFNVRILPVDNKGALSIASVTQGSNGSVCLNNRGRQLHRHCSGR
jgi:hypothetical protein